MERPEQLAIAMSFDYGDIEISFKLKGNKAATIARYLIDISEDQLIDGLWTFDFDGRGNWVSFQESDGLCAWTISETEGIKVFVPMLHDDLDHTKPPTINNLDNFLDAVRATRRVLQRIDQVAAKLN